MSNSGGIRARVWGSVLGVALLSACLPTVPASAPVAVQSASETSVAYVSGANGVVPATWLVAYNDNNNSLMGWALSINDGASWTTNNAWTIGSGGPGVPIPAGPDQGLDSLGRPLWAGDPAIAASPDGTVVAMTNLAFHKPGSGVDRVTVSLSFDGGRTFPLTDTVNSTGCNDGFQDQQSIAFDPTRDIISTGELPEMWIAFRHDGLGSTGTYGACARGARIDPDARTLTWLRPADDVDNLDRDFTRGVGGLIIQARQGVVSVMYANTDYFGRDANFNPICPAGSSGSVRWFINESTDNGNNWTNAEYIAGPASLPCFVNGVEIGIRNFGFAEDVNGVQYFAVPSGANGGQTIDIHRRERGTGGPAAPTIFDAQIQRTSTIGAFWPTLATDGVARVAILWGTAIGTTPGTQVEYRMATRGLTRGWDTLGVRISGPPNPSVGSSLGVGQDGDFLGIAGRTNDVLSTESAGLPAFLGAWTDSSQLSVTGTPQSVMAGAIQVN